MNSLNSRVLTWLDTMNAVGVTLVPQGRAASSDSNATSRPTTPRRDYSISEKRGICRLREEFPHDNMTRFSSRVRRQMGIDVLISTVSRIISQKERWNGATLLHRRRLRDGKYAQLEEALMAWANNWLRHHGVLTYSLLQTQAMVIGSELGITAFQYSDGWVWRFCNRRGLALKRRVGESACAN